MNAAPAAAGPAPGPNPVPGPARRPSGPAPALLVVGEALVDVVVHPDGRSEEHPGGSPANVALTLGRLGHAPRLLTAIGDDAAGQAVAAWLRDSHVDLDPRSVVPGPTSRATARLDAAGAARYDFDVRWNPPDVPAGDVDLVHVGSISALLAPGAATVRRLVAEARPRALVSYDPNIRPALVTDAAASRAAVEDLVAAADIVKVSDEDLAWLDRSAPPEAVAQRWLAAGPAAVVVTRGSEGATAFTRAGAVWTAAPPVAVRDTVGAGDTFMGAFLAGLADRGLLDGGAAGRDRLRRLGAAEVEDLLGFSAAAAAVTVSRAGADPPWRRELP
ncbi:MAG: carbohydrate kinase [Propionibacteriaceae bacterium]|nr:carbohydrate kinase [Propionibacteriaceae bacterium]